MLAKHFCQDIGFVDGASPDENRGTGIGIEGFMRSPHALASRYGVVVSETIARKGMGESMAPAFDKPLQDGAEFEIIQSTSQWTLGRFSGIGEAWVRNDSIIIR